MRESQLVRALNAFCTRRRPQTRTCSGSSVLTYWASDCPSASAGGSRISLSVSRLPAACTPRSVRAARCSCTLFGFTALSALTAPARQKASKMSPSIVFTPGFTWSPE